MDIVSGGELFRALRAGTDPKKIVYAGVGKTAREIAEALARRHPDVQRRVGRGTRAASTAPPAASACGRRSRCASTRTIDPLTHPYIATGLKESKFGITTAGRILETYRTARRSGTSTSSASHCHIGSQITQVAPFREAVEKIADLVRQVRALGTDLRYVDIGGGLGISYNQEEPPEPKRFSAEILPVLKSLDATIITEPGRVIVGNAGALLTRVIYRKDTSAKNFLVVDAGMNDLIRPSSLRLLPPDRAAGQDRRRAPRRRRRRPDLRVRRLPRQGPRAARRAAGASCVAVLSAGAYGFAMSSNYNSRPRAAEVLVRGGSYSVIRARESYEDLVRGEAAAGALVFRAPDAR